LKRLFVGIRLDDTTREACAAIARRLEATGFDAAYEDASKLHMTLAFLGNVDEARYAEILATMHATAGRHPRFAIDLDKLGAFPHERKPRVVYIGAREQGRAFRELALALQGAYAAIGFTFGDDPVAHVTIARNKAHPRSLPSIEVAPIPVAVDAVALFESIFDKQHNTSRYEIRSSARLSKAQSRADG
jgi:RNA 2',3'-cyclic 3'-phosphodiesterase